MKNKFQSITAPCLLTIVYLLLAAKSVRALPPAGAVRIFDSFNRSSVSNNPSILPVFTLTDTQTINSIWNYHWNFGTGQDPISINGNIRIYNNNSGFQLGSWPASDISVLLGAPPNTFWEATPNIVLGPGSYRIEDTGRDTWSYSTTQSYLPGADWQPYRGFSQVYATPVPEPLTILGTGVVLGAIPVLKKEYAKRKKKKDEDA